MAHVALSAEQQELAVAVARMVAERAPSDRTSDEHPVGTSAGPSGSPELPGRGVWDGLVEMGLVGLRAPEALGGSAATAIEVALVVEKLAHGRSGAPYLGSVLALDLLVACDSDESRRLAAKLGAGRAAGLVMDATLAAPSAEGIAVDATPGGVVVGLAPDGTVTIGRAGEPVPNADLSRTMASAPDPDITTAVGRIDAEASRRWHAYGLALVCADLVGTMAGALDGAVAHARERHQFGRPVGSFQAVQHLCAEQLVTIEGARSIMWNAAWAVDALDPAEALRIARVAKAWCAAAARPVCEAAIQVWGGLGMTWECGAHRYLRRALVDRALLGDERIHLARIADDQLAAAPAGAGGASASAPIVAGGI